MELSNQLKPTERTYQLKCKVVAKNVSYEDEQSTGVQMVSEVFTFLIPEPSTQRDLFYSAWLPETTKECIEVVCQAGYPIYSPFRCALWRRTQHVGEIHLFVMTKAVEEELKLMNGENLVIEVLGEQQDNLADHQKDYEIINKKIYEN